MTDQQEPFDEVIAEIERLDDRYGIHRPGAASVTGSGRFPTHPRQPIDEWDYLTGDFDPFEPGDYIDDRRRG